MIEQLSNPDATIAGLKGQKGKSMKGGLFAKFLAAFQKQVQKGESALSSSAQTAAQPVAKVSNLHGKLIAVEMHALKKEQALASGAKAGIPFQISKAESNGEMKELFFASLKGENNLSISKEEDVNLNAEEDSSALVAGLGVVQKEHVALLGKNVKPGEQTGNGENQKGKSNLFTSNQQSVQQNRVNGSEDVNASIKERVLSGEPLKGPSEKSSSVMSNVLISAASGDKGTETKAATLSTVLFGTELQKQSSETAGKPQLVANSERSEILRTLKGDAPDGFQIKAETAILKEVKQSQQPNTGSHVAIASEGELNDGLKAGDQRIQNLSARGNLQSGQSGENSKANVESIAKQTELMDAPANPLIQNSKARAAAQGQQAQMAQVTGAERMASQSGGQSAGSFQQDSNLSQQPEALLADSSKADVKGTRGADFSAHMSYKTAQVYKPAEVMMEIARSAKDGGMKLELQLEPAHLGKVQITLQTDASKQLQVHIAVDQATSRQMLEQHLPQLRMALAQQGIDLGHFSMGMSSQGGEDGSSETGRTPFSEFTNLNEIQGDEQDGSSVRLGINTAGNGRISILA
ncbi:MAG: flagellar hook-length control protein FliK [Mariprofundaceae bacterium]